MVNVHVCDTSRCDYWNRFVNDNRHCWLYHRFEWKEVIEHAYGHECHYLFTQRDNAVTGILPLTLIRSRLFGSSLTSLPFLDFAGLVAVDEQSTQLLLSKALQIAEESNVDYIELRHIEKNTNGYQTDTSKVTLTMELGENEERLWKSLPSERRNRIRKAAKAGLTVDFRELPALPVFYKIWTENMRDLGSPAHSLAFFQKILEVLEPYSKIALVRFGKTYVGAAICLYYKGLMAVPWVSSLREFFNLYPNNILYWEAMRYALAHGCHNFDFGRSSVDSGTYKFKIRWGATPTPLYWEFKLLKDSERSLPTTYKRRLNFATSLWKRLPVGLTRWLGPKLRKNITA